MKFDELVPGMTLTLKVEQSDIDKGAPYAAYYCPLSLAANRLIEDAMCEAYVVIYANFGNKQARITCSDGANYNPIYAFTSMFDRNPKSVTPMEMTLTVDSINERWQEDAEAESA